MGGSGGEGEGEGRGRGDVVEIEIVLTYAMVIMCAFFESRVRCVDWTGGADRSWNLSLVGTFRKPKPDQIGWT
ncbi:hypothetical protein MRB53_027275 [Persea americana]|uniref:Uncharacterized protein n=1 Tax=Persea americana TaxID=3435 RepID=A0ACC2LKI5_PERAE|nr:hypothetical protein MRB53_027275 [Persea americana]